jgi:hypothetical protein
VLIYSLQQLSSLLPEAFLFFAYLFIYFANIFIFSQFQIQIKKLCYF